MSVGNYTPGVSMTTTPTVAGGGLTGATNESQTTVDVERVIGGGVFDGSASGTILLRIVGSLIATVSGSANVRLYDMGPAAGPPTAPSLRSTVTIPFADAGDVEKVDQELTPVASPSASNEIYNTARVYEFRIFLASAGLSQLVNWTGIVVE